LKLTRMSQPLSITAVCLFLVFVMLATVGFAKKTAKPIPTGKNASFTLDSMTFYGNFDNSPPGCAIAHPVIHNQNGGCAGGKGTFQDPITFAVAPEVQNKVPPGEIIYIPSLQKYFIMEDDCTSSGPGGVAVQGQGCDGELKAGVNEFDLWIGATSQGDNPGGNASNSQMTKCEDKLTASNVKVIMNAADGQPVNTTPLLHHGKCI
jgi:hypothetical protein